MLGQADLLAPTGLARGRWADAPGNRYASSWTPTRGDVLPTCYSRRRHGRRSGGPGASTPPDRGAQGAPRDFPPEARPCCVVFLRVAVEPDAWHSLIDPPSGMSQQRLLGALVERERELVCEQQSPRLSPSRSIASARGSFPRSRRRAEFFGDAGRVDPRRPDLRNNLTVRH